MGAVLDRPSHDNSHLEDSEEMDKILQGPNYEIDVPDIGIGLWIYTSLKSLSPELTLLIESDTGKTITAGNVLKSCAGLATCLSTMGIEKGDHVGIIGENTIDLCITGIGSLFVGAVMCPIDPTLKSIEFQHILNVIQPKIIFADKAITPEIVDALSKLHKEIVIVVVGSRRDNVFIPLESLIQDVSVEDFSPAVIKDTKNDLAAIVCSSGTTGMPKGVGLTHFAFAFQMIACRSIFPDGLIMHTSYFHWISGVLMLIGSTTIGLTRVLVRSTDPLTVLQPKMGLLSPSLLNVVLDHPRFQEFDASSLAVVIVGGAPINRALVDKHNEKLPCSLMRQVYGCSEVAGMVTKTTPELDIMSIGTLVPHVKIKVVDCETGNIMGADEEGELLVKSPSIMKGYVGNEEATAAAIDSDGWYHTGDIGKYTKENVVYITGRVKELMKVDNHQISPEEIEAVLAGVGGVSDAAVAGISEGENNLPMAIIVKLPNSTITQDDIIQIVQEQLSEFKQIRAGVYFVDVIPRTSTGKIKRRALQILAEELYAEKNPKTGCV